MSNPTYLFLPLSHLIPSISIPCQSLPLFLFPSLSQLLFLPLPHPLHLPIAPHAPLAHHAHRAPLHHQTHHLKQGIRGRHRRVLGVGVVRRRHFDDVGRDEVDTFQPANYRPQFARRPAAGFWGAGCGGDCGFVSW